MKKATIVAACVALLLSAQTRQAEAAGAWEVLQEAAKAGYQIYDRFIKHELTLQQALDQILAEIALSEEEILDHMDELAEVPPRACSRDSVVDFENLMLYDPSSAKVIATKMKDCLFLIHSTIMGVDSPPVADDLGFALHVLAPMVLHAYAYTGLSSRLIVAEVREAEGTIDAALAPTCHHWTSCEGTRHCECGWTCTAYNDDVGSDSRMCTLGDGDRDVAIREALDMTSAAISSGL